MAAVLLCSVLQPGLVEAGCLGCMNGGEMMLPNNIFGVCRCKCQAGWSGPLCQFAGKRGAPSSRPDDVERLFSSKIAFYENLLAKLVDKDMEQESHKKH